MVQRALISVSDKQGVEDFARELVELGAEILSTGGTARALRDAGVPVTDVSEFTDSPEIMGGRVKTLHPRVHGGILMRGTAEDAQQLESIGGKPIDLVAVNLYPFESTVAAGADFGTCVENIDIGGPSMVRSAAKNHSRVAVVVDPEDYDRVIAALRGGGLDAVERTALAAKAFAHTARYDSRIASYLGSGAGEQADASSDVEKKPVLSDVFVPTFEKLYDCRYGENPHQRGAVYADADAPVGSLVHSKSLGAGGKEISFNNMVDLDAALDAVREFRDPAAVVVKHTNPCGVAVAETLETAFRRAREGDSLSAFGGIVACNTEVDAGTAEAMTESFLEAVVAPSYSDQALSVLRKKKNLRILATDGWVSGDFQGLVFRRVCGGLVVQDRDATGPGEVLEGRVVTQRQPTEAELQSLEFAWKVCKHVKSNAIVMARDLSTVGVGAGQMSRVVSVEVAAQKAGQRARGSAMASDAFFPFPDGIEVAAKAGIATIVQPGGSKKDDEVIAAADRLGLAMVFTSVRHFRH